MADETTEKKKSKRGKLLLVVVLLAGAAGGYLLKGGGGGEAAAGAPTTTTVPQPGEMISIEPLSVNLADGHFLRVGVAIQLVEGTDLGAPDAAGEDPAWLVENGPIVRDLLISQLGGVHIAEIADAPSRDTVRAELLRQANEHFEESVYAIYFTEFVMQ